MRDCSVGVHSTSVAKAVMHCRHFGTTCHCQCHRLFVMTKVGSSLAGCSCIGPSCFYKKLRLKTNGIVETPPPLRLMPLCRSLLDSTLHRAPPCLVSSNLNTHPPASVTACRGGVNSQCHGICPVSACATNRCSTHFFGARIEAPAWHIVTLLFFDLVEELVEHSQQGPCSLSCRH